MKHKGNLRKCGLEGMNKLLGLLHEPRSHVLQSGLETVASPKAHGKGLPVYYSEFSPHWRLLSPTKCG